MRRESIILRLNRAVAQNCRTTLIRNSLWAFLGYGLRIIVQAVYFILIARALGAREYGAFVSAVAAVAILSPFCGLGASSLLTKNVSRDQRQFAVYWGNALLLIVVSATLVFVFLLVISRWLLPRSIPWNLIVMVSIADLLAMRVIDLASQAFLSFDQLRYSAKLTVLPSVFRLLGAILILIFLRRPSAGTWAYFYMAASSASAGIAILLTNSRLGGPRLAIGRIRSELLEGFYFSVSWSSQTVYNDIDKTMLAKLSTLDATGIYAAAYRLIEAAFTPVQSVLYAAKPTFFRRGQGGIDESYLYAKRLLPRMTGYSLLVFVGLLVVAPMAPVIIGGEYSRTVGALRWLALLPLFKTIQFFLADSITCAGFQGFRSGCQVAVAIVNFLLNLWLIPVYSWRGAAWSSLTTDALLAVLLFLVVQMLRRKSLRGAAVGSDPMVTGPSRPRRVSAAAALRLSGRGR